MESSSQSDLVTRRRALHFELDVNASRPLVTRPGRSRGHLYRVDPYAGVATGNVAINTGASNGDVGSTALKLPTGMPRRHTTSPGSSSVEDSASLAESSLSSSSSASGNSIGKSIGSASSSSLSDQPLEKKKIVTVSRSISWANAINVQHADEHSTDDHASVISSTGRSRGNSAFHMNPSVGIGIGSINHHHPLQKDVLPFTSAGTASNNISTLVKKKGLNVAVQHTLRLQSRKFSKAISKQKFLGNFSSLNRIISLAVPFALIVFSGAGKTFSHHSAKKLDKITKPKEFQWSSKRRLNNRSCVLNMFIDKQEPDEFNPDFKEIKPGEKNKDGTPKLHSPPKLEPGTYRTEGQVQVITRFISSVADSFRPNLSVQQHLVFAGSRDGGHLADEALKLWPPRGQYRTKLYVIADDEDAPTLNERDHSDRALQYGPIDAIEQRFQNHAKSEHIHVFDYGGQKAGLVNSYVDDDDVAVALEEEMFHVEDDEFVTDVTAVDDEVVIEARSERGRRQSEVAADKNAKKPPSYFSLKKLLQPYLEIEEIDGVEFSPEKKLNRTEHIIPYFHVDGTSAAQQFSILESAKPLLLDGSISIVGLENPGDMDVNDIIDFFHSVKYKTFLLGKRQNMRIDHLCEETLRELMSHPYISPQKPTFLRKVLQKLKIVERDHHAEMKHPHPKNELMFPPFFVAFPRGRTSYEEMTIQHMYDLFGGGGGGGQIATANDRKAPTKKKKG